MGKRCNTCGEMKLLTEFHLCRKTKDGLLGQCKGCALEYGQRYRAAHPGKEAAKKKRYRAANPGKDAQYQLAYRAANGDVMRAKARAMYRLNIVAEKRRKIGYYQRHPDSGVLRERWRAWAAANPDWLRTYKKERYEKDPGKACAAAKLYRATHVEQTKATTKKYRTENRDRFNALYMKRYAQKKNAMPAWADQAAIAAVYTEARELTRTTGVVWHVDHIVPLQHKLVCGLHVEYNLQLLSAKENRTKSNSLVHSGEIHGT